MTKKKRQSFRHLPRTEAFREQDKKLADLIARDEKRRTAFEARVARQREIVQLRDEGLTWREIGERYGMTFQAAQQAAVPPRKLPPRKNRRTDYSWKPPER